MTIATHKPRFALPAAALLMCVCLSGAAEAESVTYTYTGNPFTSFEYYGEGDTPTPGGNYSCVDNVGECAITGSFTVAAPLNDPTFTDITDSVLSYSFTDGNATWTNIAGPCPTAVCYDPAYNFTYPGGNSVIEVQTDNGQITAWSINLQYGPYNYYLDTENYEGTEFDTSNDQSYPPSDNLGDASNQDDPGTWTVTPEPASFPLCVGAIGAIAALRRRKTC